MKRILLSVLCLTVLSLAGSASYGGSKTTLTDVWKDKEYQGTVSKIAVFLIVQDRGRRILWEDEFVRQLKARGTNAMPLYVVIPPDKFVDREAALTKMSDLGADVVLIVRLVDKLTAQATIPAPDPSRRSGYYEYIYDAPVRDTSEPAYLETNLFDVKTAQRVWTARSVTKVDAADQKLFSDFITLMIDRLASDKMIK
jgi:hypothetical protein